MSLPRLLTLCPDGLLGIEPVPELSALRDRHWSFADVEVAPEATCILEGVQGDALEISATFAPDVQVGGVVVRRSPDAKEHTEIRYDRLAHGLMLRRSEASTDPQAQGGAYGGRSLAAPAPDEPLTLRVFVDRSIVEVYVNGRTALTARIYLTREDSLGVGLIARGGRARAASVDVWTLTPHSAETPA
jgi:beta-fructofuranosidase